MMLKSDIETFVLEDDVDIHVLLQTMLDDEGLNKVFLFTHSRDLLSRLNPAMRVLVIDWRLDEEMNGLDVMKIVRERNPGCYVIVVSGYANEQMIIEFLNAKADWFIKKHPHYLFELVKEIKKGVELVAKRDAIMQQILDSNNRIDNRRKLREENDAGTTD